MKNKSSNMSKVIQNNTKSFNNRKGLLYEELDKYKPTQLSY